jgi:hypothetical protein
VHFDTTLNLAWLLLGVLALAGTVRVASRQRSAVTRKARWLHTVGVALIIAALFPYISATDDVVRIQHFKAQHETRQPGKHSSNDGLMRLYEIMDSPLVCRVCEVALVFFFISIVFSPVIRLIERIAPRYTGRSPPRLGIV